MVFFMHVYTEFVISGDCIFSAGGNQNGTIFSTWKFQNGDHVAGFFGCQGFYIDKLVFIFFFSHFILIFFTYILLFLGHCVPVPPCTQTTYTHPCINVHTAHSSLQTWVLGAHLSLTSCEWAPARYNSHELVLGTNSRMHSLSYRYGACVNCCTSFLVSDML